MAQKSDLLIELGWDESLVRHFMVDDSETDSQDENQYVIEVCDSHSLLVTFNADTSGTSLIMKRD